MSHNFPIPKKARAQTCDQYRTLNLILHASQVLTRIMRRIKKKIHGNLTDYQFGFRRGMGTREAIKAEKTSTRQNE